MIIYLKSVNEFSIGDRKIGQKYKPLVIAEIGINHEGDLNKAKRMIDDAANAGCECVKFQSHIIEDEMIPLAKEVIPGNADESIWDIMKRCSFSEEEELNLKKYVESRGMLFISTPFSRAAAIRLEKMGVKAFKIGSGECNNYPLITHIAQYKKPIILSTGMNSIESISKSVQILNNHDVPYALLHCTSLYPTPFEKVRLGALKELKNAFPNAIIGLSDHSLSINPCLGAIALGASIVERHFTSSKNWPGPDIEISMNPQELKELIKGCNEIYLSLGGKKKVLKEEQVTIEFAYACVVSTQDINKGEILSERNIWVKRPGNGEIKASFYKDLIGKKSKTKIHKDTQLRWEYIEQ